MFQSVQRRTNGQGSAPGVNLAPLMDMVFILLIFFVVTTTFVRETGIQVQRPQAVWSDSLDSRSLRVSISAAGAVHTEGRRVSLAALRDRCVVVSPQITPGHNVSAAEKARHMPRSLGSGLS